MTKENEILSDIIIHMKYAKYLPDKERRETWKEIVNRNRDMHIKKYPHLKREITKVYKDYVLPKKVLPSMRSLQFAGKAAEVNPLRIYNCSYVAIDNIRAFSETLFALLSGTGVGISVQRQHIAKLPAIKKPGNRNRKYVISDDIAGWADALKILLKSYTGSVTSKVVFDYSQIREKGALLVTSGGKAPGPTPLRIALEKVRGILDEMEDGTKMAPFQAHRIACFISDAVLSGGIRRSALISLFSLEDEQMLACKTGDWYEKYPELGRANNSVVLNRATTSYDDFKYVWERLELGGAGEPGISWTDNTEYGFNPCHEVTLRNGGTCNLTEINGAIIKTQAQFNDAAIAAAFIGTLQAGYTDFYYLRDIWKQTIEEDALIGVGITGIASRDLLRLDVKEASIMVSQTNIEYAHKIGINPAKRVTVVKPAGTSSLVLATSSGIGAWHSAYYKRRVRIGKNEALYAYLAINHPELIEDEFFKPNEQAIITIPVKAPEGAILRDESMIDFLERIKRFNIEWVQTGTMIGKEMNNVSATVNVKEGEWTTARDWMWNNREAYSGISLLPYDGGTYKQLPVEEMGREEYESMVSHLKSIDLTKVVELEDNTDQQGEAACAGGACEVK